MNSSKKKKTVYRVGFCPATRFATCFVFSLFTGKISTSPRHTSYCIIKIHVNIQIKNQQKHTATAAATFWGIFFLVASSIKSFLRLPCKPCHAMRWAARWCCYGQIGECHDLPVLETLVEISAMKCRADSSIWATLETLSLILAPLTSSTSNHSG